MNTANATTRNQNQKKKSKPEQKKSEEEEGNKQPEEINMVINNYFSVGIGAQIIEDFDTFRNKHPSLITSRLVGKGWYGVLSLKRLVKPGTPVRKVLTAKCDGTHLKVPANIQELTMLNIPSIMGGADIWGKYAVTKGQPHPPTVNDKHFEVVGMKGVSHMGRIKAGLSARGGHRLGQSQTLEFFNRKVLRAQIDGEALLLPPCKVTISFHNQANLLLNIHGDKGHNHIKKLLGKDPIPEREKKSEKKSEKEKK